MATCISWILAGWNRYLDHLVCIIRLISLPLGIRHIPILGDYDHYGFDPKRMCSGVGMLLPVKFQSESERIL